MISFIIPIEPVAKGRPRFSRYGHAYTPEKTKLFEEQVRFLASKHVPPKPFSNALRVHMMFIIKPPKKKINFYPISKPDLTNLFKAVEDALNGIMWKDDSQIVELRAQKGYCMSGEPAGIHVTIEEVA